MDVAKLRYEVDSSEAKKAGENLNDMTESAAKAEKGQEKLARASTKSGKSQSAANDNVKRSVDRLTGSKGKFITKARVAGKATSVFSGLISKARFGLVGMAAAMVAIPFTFFTAGVVRGVSSALTFNKALTEVATLTKDAKANTELLTRESIRLSDTYGGSSLSQVQAFYQAISAGAGSVREASVLLEDANKLAKAGVTEIATGVDVLTTAINAYGKEVLSTKDASDAIFVGVQQGKTTVAELAAGLGNVIPIASSLGVEFDELVASIASLTTQGQSTSLAITGVSAILATIAKPSSEAAKLAKELGIEFNTTALKTKGLNQFLKDAVSKTNGSKEALAKLFGPLEALKAVLAFAGGAGEKFNQVQDEMARKSGATDEAVKTVAESLSDKYDKAVVQVSNSFQQLGEIILPAVVKAMELLAAVMQKVTASIVDNTDKLKLEFQFLNDVTTAMFKNIPSAIAVGVIGAMDFMVNSVKKGLNSLMAPVNKIIGLVNEISGKSIGTLTFDETGSNFKGLMDSIGGDAGKGVTAYEEAVRKRQAGYQSIENRRKDFGVTSDSGYLDVPTIKNLNIEIDKLTPKAKKAAKAVKSVFQSAVESLQGKTKDLQFEATLVGLPDAQASKLRKEQELLNAALKDGKKLTPELRGTISGLAQEYSLAEQNTNSLRAANDNLRESIEFGKSVTKEFLGSFINGIREGKGVWDSLKDSALGALESISNKLLDMALNNLVGNAFGGGQSSGGGGFLSGIFGSLFGGGSTSLLPGLYSSGGYTGNGAVSAAAGIVHGQEFVNNAASTAKYRPHLEAMNQGNWQPPVMAQPVPVAANSNQNIKVDVHVTGVLVEKDGQVTGLITDVADQRIRKASPTIAQGALKATEQKFPQMINDFQRRQG